MLLVATVLVTVALFIIMSMADACEARRILHGHAPPSTFNPKAMEYSQSRQYPPHVLVPPSAPNPGTHIPSASWRQRKNPPRPYMLLHGAYYQGTHIPAVSTTSTTAPMLGTP
ncbi:hypothetical protein CMV_018629 [Castanea mollissima]|uniref:Secreted protein n=1 Tax=Castanea mollissima TaxID=60419 RepID=A0A8J4QUN2_9ROSI|nr:hypothetical protein CMV_018629 [Castanea mollissima]